MNKSVFSRHLCRNNVLGAIRVAAGGEQIDLRVNGGEALLESEPVDQEIEEKLRGFGANQGMDRGLWVGIDQQDLEALIRPAAGQGDGGGRLGNATALIRNGQSDHEVLLARADCNCSRAVARSAARHHRRLAPATGAGGEIVPSFNLRNSVMREIWSCCAARASGRALERPWRRS